MSEAIDFKFGRLCWSYYQRIDLVVVIIRHHPVSVWGTM